LIETQLRKKLYQNTYGQNQGTMDTAIDINDPGKALDLANIRFQLIRLEDTVLFHIIERVQFPYNKTIYTPGAIDIPGSDLSFSEWVLREQEVMQSKIRRYQSPDEYPFFPDAMQTPILKELKYPKILWDNDVNVNAELKRRYVHEILPAACAKFGRAERAEAQENYGSAATADVSCLQALSRRIHFGKFVAESKFQSEPERFVALIKAHDTKGIDDAITNAAVEKQVLERLRLKAKAYGQDPNFSGEGGEHKVDVDAVVAMYKDHVIPLTKIVEVDYLMQRLKGTQWE
jgi:chorismate mutase